jgi:type II secretory pathway component GspD/PulD (secretin)
MRKKLSVGILFASTIAFANIDAYQYLEQSLQIKPVKKELKISKPSVNPLIKPSKQSFKYEIVGTMTVRDLLNLIASLKNESLLIGNFASKELDKTVYLNIRTNDFDTLLKAVQEQTDMWVEENPLSRTISVKKFKWITIYPDIEGKTGFSLTAGASASGGGGSQGNNQEGGGQGEGNTQGGGEQGGQQGGSSGGSGTGFYYEAKNQDVTALLDILSSLNIPAYPFMAGFVKMKVTPSQYLAVKQIMDTLKKHSEVIVGEVKIYKVDLNDNNRLGINWQAFFRGFRVGSITQATVSLGLSPFTSSDNPVSIALLNKQGQQQALIQFLEQYGKVQMVNTWVFEGKTGTLIPFGSYKEEPYITYTVVSDDQTTQVVPQVNYKYAGFMGNIFVAKQRDRYYTEIALNLSDVYGYFTLSTSDFTEQIPKLQTNQLRIATYLPHLNTTLLLTGFKLKSVSNSQQKVPFLGDLPLIGNLFKSTDKTSTTSEFVILISLYKFNKKFLIPNNPQTMEQNIKNQVKKINNFENPPVNKPKQPYEIITTF